MKQENFNWRIREYLIAIFMVMIYPLIILIENIRRWKKYFKNDILPQPKG